MQARMTMTVHYAYHVVHVMSEDAIVLRHRTFGQQLWTLGKIRGRAKECTDCAISIAVGDSAFRPLTNGYNRKERMCTPCIRAIVSAGGRPREQRARTN